MTRLESADAMSFAMLLILALALLRAAGVDIP
jgi:hypothetical protein